MNDIKQCGGIWLPMHEEHMNAWMTNRMRSHPGEMVDGKATYQYHKLLAGMKFTRNFRTAVDVGAHCGLWSMHLARRFSVLHSFEPVELHRKCFALNVPKDAGEVVLHPCALGEQDGFVAFHTTKGSSGDSWVEPAKRGDIPMKRLDDLELNLLDFIKLDCEGYELFVLRGAEETLKRCRPCVLVEQKPGKALTFGLPETEAVSYLQSLGAILRKEIGGDYILSWDGPAEKAVEEVCERKRDGLPPIDAAENDYRKV